MKILLRFRSLMLLGLMKSLLTAPPLSAAASDARGGGILHGGLVGEYFANDALAGVASFSRRDVRVDFDWGTLRRPGGSNAAADAAVGTDHFSVRWSGQLAARFSESYTFFVETGADELATLELRAEGAGSYATVVNGGNFAMVAGQRYDVRLSYREFTGAARCVLRWSSPSTPLEVVDAATLAAVNMDTYAGQLWANAMDGARDEWREVGGGNGAGPARDANGWPLGDGTIIVWEGQDFAERRGTYTLRFTGRAQVATAFYNIQWSTGATNHGLTLPFAAGWDALTNTTTATMNIVDGSEILYLTMTNTRRLPSDTTATGVTNVQLLRPTAPGGVTPQVLGTVTHAPFKSAVGRYSALRWILNFDTDQAWVDRVASDYSTRGDVGRSRSWEHMVMLSNETGKDLYLCLPVRGNDDYYTKLAQLLRYGSDGVNPYTSEQANPVYPPLNSNLRAIVERENEIWNFAFTNFGNNQADLRAAQLANHADWQAVNFDSAYTNNVDGAWIRWHALRTVRVSQFFRNVWGDAAMGPRIRVIYEYQYDNGNDTAQGGLGFLERYFANSAGTSPIAEPHPLNYHLWGAGGAVYYGSGNPQGVQNDFGFANAGLETPVLAEGGVSTTPAGAGWTFTGTAGVYRAAAKTAALSNVALGGTLNPPGRFAAGLRFTTGAQPLAVYGLGRWSDATSMGYHAVSVVRASDGAGVAGVELPASNNVTAGAYRYGMMEASVVLAANTSYYLVSSEGPNDGALHDNTTVTSVPGLTVNSRVFATYGNPEWDSSLWTFSEAEAGSRTFGPVNLLIATTPQGVLNFPPDPVAGSQAAWIAGTGQMQQQIMFPAAGTYALSMQAAAKESAENGVRLYFDNTFITPIGSSSAGARTTQWIPGEGFNRSSRRYELNTSYVFTVAAPGLHTLRIEGLGIDRYSQLNTPPDASRVTYFDDLRLASATALFAGGIPGAGEANGQITAAAYGQQLNNQARFAQAYGLQVVAYEGGWSIGGDFNSNAFQNWCKHFDPRARNAQTDSINFFARSGSRLYTFGTYDTWPNRDTLNSGNYPLAQAVDDHNSALPVEPTNGVNIPAVLLPQQARWSQLAGSGGAANLNGRGGWFYWNVLVPTGGTYQLATATGAGGSAIMELDGSEIGSSFATGGTQGTSLTLTPGLHALKVRSTLGAFSVGSLTLSQSGSPATPVLTAAQEGAARVSLAWSAVPGATSYLVRYGQTSGLYDQTVDAGSSTTRTLTGLTNGTIYYFIVVARNAAGNSLPSNERGAAPAAPNTATTLARWEFTGLTGLENAEPSDPPDSTSGNAIVSSVTRGPGLSVGYNQYAANSFASGSASSNTYGTDLATAQTKGQYYEISLTAAELRTLSLSRVDFRPCFQDQAAGATVGAGLTYSLNGSSFTAAPAATGTATIYINNGALLSVDLSQVVALQNVAGPITLRMYTWGAGPYQCTGLGGPGDDLIVTGSYGLLPGPLDNWRTLHGLAADGSQDLQNPSNDGVSNLLKYAFNLAPNVGQLSQPTPVRTMLTGGTAGLPLIARVGNHLRAEFIRRKASTLPGISYTLVTSSSLTGWLPVTTAPTLTSVDATWERAV